MPESRQIVQKLWNYGLRDDGLPTEFMVFTALLVLLPMALCPGQGNLAEATARSPLEQAEGQFLNLYLEGLKAGNPSRAAALEKLDGAGFECLARTIEAYAALPPGTSEDTHRAFHDLLDRLSRAALNPFPVIEFYSPELASWMVRPMPENPLAARLWEQLLASGLPRVPYEMAVRLSPEASLAYLEKNLAAPGEVPSPVIELLAAWNRRLDTRPESRPIPGLAARIAAIAKSFRPDHGREALQEHLTFLGRWPSLRKDYEAALGECLRSPRTETVLAALEAQRSVPALLDANEALIRQHSESNEIVEKALRNFAFDPSTDHSTTLHRLWPGLAADRLRRQYFCLYAMGVHPAGNADIALEAVRTGEPSFFDVGLHVLRDAAEEQAREAVSFILLQGERGHEEALRFARERSLPGFEPRAAEIFQASPDQIVKQAALYYLQVADGPTRRKLMGLLKHPNDDIRLAAIQMFARVDGLEKADRNDFGVALTRVFLEDSSPGHRQEALFILGLWKDPEARPVLGEALARYPKKADPGKPVPEDAYWDYRFRLVALLGLARLGDPSARTELEELHRLGSPQEKLDALLAFLDLGQAPPGVLQDLSSAELKLAAAAAELIDRYGTAEEKNHMRELFSRSPLWKLFAESGLRHHGLLRHAGLSSARKGMLYE
ncbi:MAG: HEAT repeat domain-containing protein [Planctomycetes bacterium]|nr:HEAT repeat domain-containing protein [Planctomycetota bacterium]